ncbi:hypothetical protein RHMOL_Rhmol03G0132900 [Rhododendron molle]|uniref:Uncharacterized protein n=1 Tax=Rhododendron molle TaxID=49168 RepID=A0ACC0PFE9_RHOML|nr:hypothetical protein RHMOL_Rhmol03G0132900 [Rhododendron molle]
MSTQTSFLLEKSSPVEALIAKGFSISLTKRGVRGGGGDFSISVWKNSLYAFTFDLEEDLIKITNQAPWSVMGGLLVLTRWDHDKSVEELDFSSSPFWVQVHGLPLGQINKKNGSLIASMIGQEVVQGNTSFSSARFQGYLHLRVIIDITKPLKKGFFLKREGKEDLWIKFKYERLSDFCYVCGRIGHGMNDCNEGSAGDRSNLEFGSYLRAEVSIIETINQGTRAPSPPSSSSENLIVAADILDKVARGLPENVVLDGTTSVRNASSLGESTTVVHGKPTIGTEEPIRTTCPFNSHLERSEDKRGNDSILPLSASHSPRIVPPICGTTTHIPSGFNLAQVDSFGPPSKMDYFVEEPPDSPVRGEPLIPLTHTLYKSPSQPLSLPSTTTPEPPYSHTPNTLTLTQKSPTPLPKTSTVGLSTVFENLLYLKRKAPSSSPSFSLPSKLQRSRNPNPVALRSVPIDEIDNPTMDGETILPDSTGCERTRRVVTRRASGTSSKGKKLCDVLVKSSFNQNQSDLLAYPVEVTPIYSADSSHPAHGDLDDKKALVAGLKQPHAQC